MPSCEICQRRSVEISRSLGLCASCILEDSERAGERAVQAHRHARESFGLPQQPPRAAGGIHCTHCANACRIGTGEAGYCGVRRAVDGCLAGGDRHGAAVSWYRDPLPTNCVADWVCPASSSAKARCHNLAVFYEACSFDCLFCQNWHFRERIPEGLQTAEHLAAAVNDRTHCVCFFGGDPSCQIDHALISARKALEAAKGRVMRVCWETNGSVSRGFLRQMIDLSLESGGCLKFDLKAFDLPLHRALCGVSNRPTLANFELVASFLRRRPDPPLLIAATCLVPGYVDAEQVGKIARFIAHLDRTIPYALLAFHPAFEMSDLPTTSRRQAEGCFQAAKDAGLTRVRIGNAHLLR